MFLWAASSIKFDKPSSGSWMKRGLYWIKDLFSMTQLGPTLDTNMKQVYFLNLAVKMKLHLNNLKNPQVEGTNCQSLFEFYDCFSYNPKYNFIHPRDFKHWPIRVSTVGKQGEKDDWEEFGELPDRIKGKQTLKRKEQEDKSEADESKSS